MQHQQQLPCGAELPRVINVQQFAAAREPELRGLWKTLEALGRLAPGQLLLRHLRRRATSHKRYICRRRPNLKLAQHRAAATATGTTTEAASSSSSSRPLNRRQRRRPALLQAHLTAGGSLHTAADAGGSSNAADGSSAELQASPQRLESHVWHARRMRMCVRYGYHLAEGAVGRGKGSRSLLRQALLLPVTRDRRSRHYQLPPPAAAAAAGAAAAASATGNTPTAVAVAVAGTAARASGPVRAVVHDASYWGCLQLEGQQQQLVQLLSRLSDPQQLQQLLSRPEVLGGAVEMCLLLHMPDAFPAASIGPVKLLWHPRPRRQQQLGLQKQQQQQAAMEVDQTPPQQQQQQGVPRWQRRQQKQQREQQAVWLWCHAAYLQQLADALSSVIQQQQQQQQSGGAMRFAPLSSSLRRLELTGPSADAVLRSVITQQQHWCQEQQQQSAACQHGTAAAAPAAAVVGGSSCGALCNPVWQALLNCTPQQQQQQQQQPSAWLSVPAGAVLGLAALDPRLAKPPRHSGAFGTQPSSSCLRAADMHATAAASASAVAGSGGRGLSNRQAAEAAAASVQQLVAHWPSNVRRWLGPGAELLHHPGSWPHAASEAHISMWRQQQQQLAALGASPAWQQQHQPGTAAATAAAIAAGKPPHVTVSLAGVQTSAYGITGQAPDTNSSSSRSVGSLSQQQPAADNAGDVDMAAAAATDKGAGADVALLPIGCPLLLVRQAPGGSAAAGWSLLLPAGWVMPFWMALTYAGAKPVGQREWSWIAAARHQPLPPLDYPDSRAAAAAAAELHAATLSAAVARPIGRLNSSSHTLLPYLDWSKVGRLVQLGTSSESMPAAVSALYGQGGQAATKAPQQQQQQQTGAAEGVLAQVQDCWMQAYRLQSGAAANKQRDRQHRRHLKKQQQQQQLAPTSIDNQQQPKNSSGSSSNPPSRQVMRRLRQEQHTVRQLQHWREQHQQSLLPAGFYIAHSWRVVQAALPAAAAAAGAAFGDMLTQQQQQQQGLRQPSPAAAAAAAEICPQVFAGGQRHSKALQRAVHTQQLAWVPVGAAAPQPAAADDDMDVDNAAAAAAADGASEEGAVAATAAGGAQAADPGSQQLQVSGDTCLVRVAVRVIGKGRCMQGAVLVMPAECGDIISSSSKVQTAGSSSSSSSNAVSVLGFVTAAVPRGAPAQLYPGGSGLCSVRCLWALRCKDARPGSSRVLRAWLLNPGSTVLRRVELRLLLDA